MKISLLLIAPLFALILPASADEVNTLTDAEKAAGWSLLFDGKDLAHWRNYKKEGVSEKWAIADGAFTLTEKGGGDIITKETYGAFEMTLDQGLIVERRIFQILTATEDKVEGMAAFIEKREGQWKGR